MRNKTFNKGWYTFAFTGGLLSGLLFSKSQYFKGKFDAYTDMEKRLSDIFKSMENTVEKEA